MGKKIFFVVVLVLVGSVYKNQSYSRELVTGSPASTTLDRPSGMHPKYRTPYRIVSSRYVSRSNIKHTSGQGNNVRVRIMQNGADNTDIEDLYMGFDSGVQYRMGNIYGIENSSLPLYVKVTYRSWNTFHAVQVDVNYEFVIFYPGTWDVTIFN